MINTTQTSNPYLHTPAIRLTSTAQFISAQGLHPNSNIVVEYLCFCNHDPTLADHPVTVKDGAGMFLAYLKPISAKEPTDIPIPESGVLFTSGIQIFTDTDGAGLVDCFIRCRRAQ